jgi:hypothetical protein
MMTKRSKETQRKLQQDIESFTCGEVPNPLEIMRAAKLENWESLVRRRGKEFVMTIRGDVYRHPEIDDGQNIQTPAVVWFDRKDRFVRTGTRLYVLGEQIGREIPIEGIDV